MPEPTPEPTPEQWQQIQQFLSQSQLIQAIKAYREATGVGLKEAKDAMEAYWQKLHAEAPDRFPERTKAGCMSMILIAVTLATAVGIAAKRMV